MSSSEELSQYESKPNKPFKPLKDTARDGNHPVIPRDMHDLYGVHVSNLPSGISEMLIEKTFSLVGRVQVCKIMEKRHFPSYAFVKYSLRSEAQHALSKFDGYKLNGSVLAVRPAYVSNKGKRNHSPRVKNDQYETSSDDSQVKINGKGREDSPVTSHPIESSDCRIKDGRLSDSDVKVFNGTSSKTTLPRKANSGQLLAPQFKKDSLPKSSASDTSCESHQFQDGVPSHMSTASSSETVHSKPVYQMPISSAHTSPGHVSNNADLGNNSSSAFRPYQGKFQEPYMQNGGAIENGITSMSSAFSNLRFTSPEKRNAWNHSEGSGDMLRWQGGAPGVTTWSQTGGTEITTWSNYQNRLVNTCSPGRNQGALAAEWSPQSKTSVSSWSTADVVQYFYSTDCANYADFFQEQEIDGKALMLLNRDTLLQFMKVGPALKVLQIIEELKSYSSLPTSGSNSW